LRKFDAWVRRHIDTFAQLTTANSVLDRVITDRDLPTSPRDLALRISVVQPENRAAVSLEVTGEDRHETLATTTTLGQALAAQIEALSPRDGRGDTLVRARSLGASVSQVEGER